MSTATRTQATQRQSQTIGHVFINKDCDSENSMSLITYIVVYGGAFRAELITTGWFW